MDFSLTEEQKSIRKEIVHFATRELNGGIKERDREGAFPKDLWLKCGEMRLQGLPVPETYGGVGLDPLTTAIALEALGYGCHDSGLVFSICAHLLACVVPIWEYGTEEQKERYLPDLCGGRLIAVNAMSEPGSGSDAFSMSTRAEPAEGGFALNGIKTFCTNGPIADLAVVYALTDPEKRYHGGVTAFLVEKGTDGFEVGQTFEKMGLHTSPIGELVFDNVRVPEENVLGEIGGGSRIFSGSMDWERICLFAFHVGVMERLLEKSIEYSRTRVQFGQPTGNFQSISNRIADMKVRLEASRLLTYWAAWHLDHARSAMLEASISKLFVSEAHHQAALSTLQIFGGYGYMAEYEVERAVRDALAGTIYSGTSEMQRNIIARWLGLQV